MKHTKISVLASALVVFLAGCGGGGDGEITVKNKYKDVQFDSFGDGVKVKFFFDNDMPDSEKVYKIKSVTADPCPGKEIFPKGEIKVLGPKSIDDKPGETKVEVGVEFENDKDNIDVELANKCIAKSLTVEYEEILQGGVSVSKIKTFPNPNYEQTEVAKLDGDDPLYKYQWHLKNTGQSKYSATSVEAGNDIKVEDVHNAGKTGKGVKIAVIDEGIDIYHPDLKNNIDRDNSYNYHNNTNDTTPWRGQIVEDKDAPNGGWYGFPHGTAVAGIIAAEGWNGIGVRGVAPNAKLVSYNALEVFKDEAENLYKAKKIPSIYNDTALQEERILDALTRGCHELNGQKRDIGIDIYNNSWGSEYLSKFGIRDDRFIDGIFNQLKYGVDECRGGSGSVYVKSAGNGHNSNMYPENASGKFVIVSATKGDGKPAPYSSYGANVLVNAPGGDSSDDNVKPDEKMIVTTDLAGKDKGYDRDIKYQAKVSHMPALGNENYDYTQRMNGTSAAAPMVSGVVALMLEENPNLSWRDVWYILAKSAYKNHKNDTGWMVNKAGVKHHPSYGFGRVDAKEAVKIAKGFDTMGAGNDVYSAGLTNSSESSYKKSRGFDDIMLADIKEDKKVEHVMVEFGLELDNNETRVINLSPIDFAGGSVTKRLFKGKNIVTVTNDDLNTTSLSISYKTSGVAEEPKEIVKDLKGSQGGSGDKKEEKNKPKTIEVPKTGNYTFFKDGNSSVYSVTIESMRDKNKLSHISVKLTSPMGTTSTLLANPAIHKDTPRTFEHIRLSSVEFLDESSKGEWKMEIETADSELANFTLSSPKPDVVFVSPKITIRGH